MEKNNLTEVVAKWFEEQGWEERPEVDEETNTSSVSFKYQLNDDFTVKDFIEVDEGRSFLKIYVYFFDTKIPESKMIEVLKWANLVNLGYAVGTLQILPEERNIRCYHGMDFEDAAFETQHITNIVKLMHSSMEFRLPQLMAICFGGKSAQEAYEMKPE